MSEREKTLTEQIGRLTPQLQDDFLKMAIGAAMAMERQDATKDEDHGTADE